MLDNFVRKENLVLRIQYELTIIQVVLNNISCERIWFKPSVVGTNEFVP